MKMKTPELKDPSGPLGKAAWPDLLNTVDEADRPKFKTIYQKLAHASFRIENYRDYYATQKAYDPLGLGRRHPLKKPSNIALPFMESKSKEEDAILHDPEMTEVDLDNLYVLLRAGFIDKLPDMGTIKVGRVIHLMNNQIDSQNTEK